MNRLQLPEFFPLLPPRAASEREFLAWSYTSFEAHTSWSIFNTKMSGECFVRRLEYAPRDKFTLPFPDIYGAESPLPTEAARNILSAFEALCLPPFRQLPGINAFDGEECAVVLRNPMRGSPVNLRAKHSKLTKLFALTIETLDRAVPASTLRTHGR